MEKKLKVANIGMKFGMCHVEGAMKYSGAEIAALCDCNEENLRFAGERYGIPEEKWVTDYMDIVNNPDIDVVTVAIPDQQHVKVSCDLLRAGKHVLCEKPLALTREDIEEMVRVADESGAKFMVGQICRFTPAFEKAKEIIESGTLGELYFVESEYAHDYVNVFAKRGGNWRCDPQRNGVVGGGCHAVDLLRWIAGNPVETTAYSNHKVLTDWPVDDTTIAIFRFPNQVIGKVFTSIGCKRNYTMRTVLYGTRGTIIVNNTDPVLDLYQLQENGSSALTQLPLEINNHNVQAEHEIHSVHGEHQRSGEDLHPRRYSSGDYRRRRSPDSYGLPCCSTVCQNRCTGTDCVSRLRFALKTVLTEYARHAIIYWYRCLYRHILYR